MSDKQDFFSLFNEKGIYGKVKDVTFEDFLNWTGEEAPNSLDLNCPSCKENKTFVKEEIAVSNIMGRLHYTTSSGLLNMSGSIKQILYVCPTCGEKLIYIFYYDGNNAIKIAQYPSLYDMSRNELKKYQKNDLIDKESFEQIYKADICASENYFVAAYTYMRRVYENMLLSVFHQNLGEIDVTEEEYKKLRSDEKMEKIKPFLAIEEEIYKPLYALLSAGIHSLTEEECCEDYILLKSILIDVLAEQKARKEKEINRKKIKDLYSKKKGDSK